MKKIVILIFALFNLSCGRFWGSVINLNAIKCPSTDNHALSTVQDFNYAAGFDSYGYSSNIVEGSPRGVVFSSGVGKDSANVAHWLARKLSGQGGTWTTVDDYNLASNQDATVRGMVKNPTTGNLFAAGNAVNSIGKSVGVVRKATNDGNTWTTVDTFSQFNINEFFVITIDPSGNLFTCGDIDTGANRAWVVRKSSDQGLNWTTALLYQTAVGFNSIAFSCFAAPNGSIYVGGYATDASGKVHWLTQRSIDKGVTWVIVDDFLGDPTGVDNAVNGFAQTPSALIVSGYSTDAASHYFWTVRRSTDNGATWSMSEKYQLAINQNAVSNPAFSDACGNLYIGGYASDGSGNKHGIIRRSFDSGISWSTFDDYQLAAGFFIRLWSGGLDSLGNLYTGYQANDSANVAHWIVRKF